jgi:hypothetical protein
MVKTINAAVFVKKEHVAADATKLDETRQQVGTIRSVGPENKGCPGPSVVLFRS